MMRVQGKLCRNLQRRHLPVSATSSSPYHSVYLYLYFNTPPGAKLGLCRSTIYSKFFIGASKFFFGASKLFFEHPNFSLSIQIFLRLAIFFLLPNCPPPDHNLGQILNSDPASSYFPLKFCKILKGFLAT